MIEQFHVICYMKKEDFGGHRGRFFGASLVLNPDVQGIREHPEKQVLLGGLQVRQALNGFSDVNRTGPGSLQLANPA